MLLWLLAFASLALGQDGGAPPVDPPPPEEVSEALYTIWQAAMATFGGGGVGAGGASLYARWQIGKLEKRVDVLEKALDEASTKAEVNAIRDRLTALEAQDPERTTSNTENAEIAALVARVVAAETTLSRLDGRADDSQTQRATHEALLGRLREDLDGLRTENRDEHRAIKAELASRLDRLADRVASVAF